MMVEFSIVPIGKGASFSASLAAALEIVDKSGLTYRIGPMGTVLEGEWDQVMKVIKACHEKLAQEHERVITQIKIDDRKGTAHHIDDKVASVEKKIGRPLKKLVSQ